MRDNVGRSLRDRQSLTCTVDQCRESGNTKSASRSVAATRGIGLQFLKQRLQVPTDLEVWVEVDTTSLPEGQAALVEPVEAEILRMLREAERPAGVFLAVDRQLYVEIQFERNQDKRVSALLWGGSYRMPRA